MDTKPPQIDISSDSRTSSGTLIVEVRIQDNVKVEEDKVEILVPNFTTASQECRRDVRNGIVCTLTLQGNEDEVVQGKIQVRVTDEAGNPNTLDSEILTIDKQKPTLTPKTPSFSEQGKIQHFSFTAEDAGVGLWKDRETGSNASSLTYGFASSQDC